MGVREGMGQSHGPRRTQGLALSYWGRPCAAPLCVFLPLWFKIIVQVVDTVCPDPWGQMLEESLITNLSKRPT